MLSKSCSEVRRADEEKVGRKEGSSPLRPKGPFVPTNSASPLSAAFEGPVGNRGNLDRGARARRRASPTRFSHRRARLLCHMSPERGRRAGQDRKAIYCSRPLGHFQRASLRAFRFGRSLFSSSSSMDYFKKGECIVCGIKTPQRCSGCKQVGFCSAAHQKLVS